MLASRGNRMGCAWSFVILCMVIVLSPGSHANYPELEGHHDPERGVAVGMDLGSETSRIGIIKDGKFEVLHEMPSCIAFTDLERLPPILSGEEAREKRSIDPARTICDPKFLIGQRWSDPKLQEMIEGLPYRVVEGNGGWAAISVNIRGKERVLPPELITGMLMFRLNLNAADKLGEKIASAVVAVPAHFNDYQRRIIKDAGSKFSLEVLRVVNEFAAAGIAYEIDRTEDDANFIVMDLGASKTEITAVFVEEGVMEQLATVSEPTLTRGHNRRLVNYVAAQCAMEGSLLDQRAQIELEDSLELAQKNRSFGISAYCLRADSLEKCPGLPICTMKDQTQGSDTSMSTNVLEPLQRVLQELNMSIEWEESNPFLKKDVPYIPSNISNVAKVIAVGGFSKSPMVTWLLEALRWNEHEVDRDFDPEEAVLKGAAIQAAVLSGDYDDMVTYVDVTPVGLGLETSQGYMQKIIRRYTPFPDREAQNLTTAYDNQESMLIRVFEGDFMMARDNLWVGDLEIIGIPPAPRHVPIVEVLFQLDPNSILKVHASCINTTVEASATFDTSNLIKKPNLALRYGVQDDEQFEETEPIDRERMELYLSIVQLGINRDDVIELPHNADDFDIKKEANKVVRETREWLDTQSDTAPYTEFELRKSKLWDIMHDLLHYNPRGKIYSVGPRYIPLGGG